MPVLPCPGAVTSALAPACPQPSEALPCSVQRDPFTADRGHGYSSSAPCPTHSSQHLCTPNWHRPTSHVPGRAPGAGLELLHTRSTHRALQLSSSSQQSPASSGAAGEGRVFQKPSGDGQEKGFVQPAPGSGASHGGSRKAQGAEGRGGFGLVGAALSVSGSKKHHSNVLGLCPCSVSNHSHTEQEQKQRRALAPSLPLAEPSARPHSFPGSLAPLQGVQLQGLSLTDCAPQGCLS